MFELKNLLDSNNFIIQCHDNPDADSIASAFALHTYFTNMNKASSIIYSGRFKITKANLVEMISALNITIGYIETPTKLNSPLIIVDGQYGAGNVTKFESDSVTVIDHHKEEKSDHHHGIIDSTLGSCSTLMWSLLRKENFPFHEQPSVSTALYYGLYTDSCALSEISHPLDKDMRDSLDFNQSIMKKLRNTNLSLVELNIAGTALTRYITSTNLNYAIFKSDPCDPNILGFISDLALQVDSIDSCIVYSLLQDGAKLSIRCCTREVMASDFAEFLTRDVGSGGGHKDKAGGFIFKSKVEALGLTLDDFIHQRACEYFTSFDVIDSVNHSLNIASMKRYKKLKIPIGYAVSTDIFPAGAPLLVRTLEGDGHVIADDDIYFMVGILGETYPIDAEKFHRSYVPSTDPILSKYSYSPTVRDRVFGTVKELTPFLKPCVAIGEVFIHAEETQRDTKVFTEWNTDGYMLGKKGDYIAVRSDDNSDVYVIRGDILKLTYTEVDA